MFMIAMLIALVGYAVYPTAPPRLMAEWGFTDSIQQFTGIKIEQGPGSALFNAYAGCAIDARLLRADDRGGDGPVGLIALLKLLWCLYPLCVVFVVIATGNHYLTDVFLGALTGPRPRLSHTVSLPRSA